MSAWWLVAAFIAGVAAGGFAVLYTIASIFSIRL